MIGDVVGRPGRETVSRLLPALREELALQVVVANGENAAGGFGLTPETADELFAAGVDVITTGNHVWDQRQAWPALASFPCVLRPANYPPSVPGHGSCRVPIGDTGAVLCVINLQGRLFLPATDCPFRAIDSMLEEERVSQQALLRMVDFHAEATSEKLAMAHYLDGRVAALVGTHTHVPTADCRVFPRGMAYVTDAGMVGAINSVIGMEPEEVITHFRTQRPARLRVASGPSQLQSVLITIDAQTGRAADIVRVDRMLTS